MALQVLRLLIVDLDETLLDERLSELLSLPTNQFARTLRQPRIHGHQHDSRTDRNLHHLRLPLPNLKDWAVRLHFKHLSEYLRSV